MSDVYNLYKNFIDELNDDDKRFPFNQVEKIEVAIKHITDLVKVEGGTEVQVYIFT